ncbi:histidine phosphatase family protein [Actinospica durhamensis]|uniref:Histidine phosphatase family protein n=1 Tax=Actinospica durhamensis TaxID=1508375 RepID=A0A941EYD4_9ACTN|nr:histidine phosphatase family protein [Actinospica durhamensis]MBR7838642.1 histidine phosphatase family protein [Actinospica durhamensis]
MTDVTELVLARHGEAVINLEFLDNLDGVCTGLTERGRVQADLLGARLAERMSGPGRFDVLCHSPIRRAVETTERVLAAFGPHELPVEPVEALRSADHGAPGRNPWNPATNRIGTIPPLAPHEEPNPGSETWSSYLDRSSGALLEIARRHAGLRVLVIAHAETAGSALHAFLRLPPEAARLVYPLVSHTGLTGWRHAQPTYERSDPAGQWALMYANDDTHLPVEDRIWSRGSQ